jgi:predicted Zn-dependent protease
MHKDRFDQLCVIALVVVTGALVALLATAGPSAGRQAESGLDRRIEQEMLAQARIAFLERHYGAVVAMRDRGELQSALLKLEELERQLPGEPHGALLRGEVLHRMGLIDRAVASLAKAVRGHGDYIDPASPLNQRDLIALVAGQGVPLLRDRLRGQPDDRQTAATLKDAYYLQSRLAGGCE